MEREILRRIGSISCKIIAWLNSNEELDAMGWCDRTVQQDGAISATGRCDKCNGTVRWDDAME